jgi:hypothetical protein
MAGSLRRDFLKQGAIEMAHLVSKGISSSDSDLAPYAEP